MTCLKPSKPPKHKRRSRPRLDKPDGRTVSKRSPRPTRWPVDPERRRRLVAALEAKPKKKEVTS